MKARYALIAFVPWFFIILAYRVENRWLNRARNAGLLLCLVPFLGILARGEEPSTSHIQKSACTVAVNKEFTTYGLYYHITYTDKPPYDLFVETTQDYESLYDECQSFLLSMEMAQIKEAVQNGKAEMKRKHDEHYFLDAKKIARK